MVTATVVQLVSVAGVLFYLRFLLGLLKHGRRKLVPGSIAVRELEIGHPEYEQGADVHELRPAVHEMQPQVTAMLKAQSGSERLRFLSCRSRK